MRKELDMAATVAELEDDAKSTTDQRIADIISDGMVRGQSYKHIARRICNMIFEGGDDEAN